VRNRFAELLEDAAVDCDSLQALGTAITECELAASSTHRPAVSTGARIPLREQVRAEEMAVRLATTPEELKAACAALSGKKKGIKKALATAAFDESTLCAPRDDKRKAHGIHPLHINWETSYSPADWKR
jgi:hypothetical protein